jgi:hypothetical protein
MNDVDTGRDRAARRRGEVQVVVHLPLLSCECTNMKDLLDGMDLQLKTSYECFNATAATCHHRDLPVRHRSHQGADSSKHLSAPPVGLSVTS